jgi:pilus assembly protein Flp/PilA
VAGAFLFLEGHAATHQPIVKNQKFSEIRSLPTGQNRLFGSTILLILLRIQAPSLVSSNTYHETISSGSQTQEFCNMLKITQFLHNDSGATAIEYGLIAAGIAVAIIAVVLSVGSNLNTTFQEVSDNLK